MSIMGELRLDHARVRVDVNHASLMLKCQILILSLIWSSSNLLMLMMIFLVISNKLE